VTVSVRRLSSSIAAAASAAVVTFGLVTVPPERYDSMIIRTEMAAVQLQTAVSTQVAAIMNTAVADASAASWTTGTLTPSASAAAAAATSGGDFLASLGRSVLNIVGALLAPVWWAAFPITYQIYLSAQQRAAAPAVYLPNIFTTFGWFWAPLSLGQSVFPESTPTPAIAAATSSLGAEAPVNPVVEGLDLAAPAVDTPTTSGTVRAAATNGSDILATIGSVAATIVGILLAPLWYLSFPITFPLTVASVNAAIPSYPGYDYGIGSIQRAFGAVFGWLGFPFLISSTLFPQAATEPAVTPSASSISQRVSAMTPETAIAAQATTAVPNTAVSAAGSAGLQTTPQRGSAQRGRSLPQPEATSTAPVDAPPVTPAAVPATATSDETITPTQSELAADATSNDAAETAPDVPSVDTAAPSTATQQSNQAPSRQREGKTRATRATADAGRAS